ncbi:putative integral membrane protein [Cellulomonas flavigena DSM 20109]|uniref:Putative integral membrane protein n=1 Tax=Cellulomonas flavigena (strain ATCC 482 / DSM 20109 / BCRC 11376 / JCM 18109 / NBRC 3775 / NCIMB 8073 / NRS 134) TaxID=446466 RepID=D5UKU0_CELFN|nr:hypothetical protein [Cellulomonas flavigena]ADG73908.1 putative integral membrane protein [Cellulomonas flavigena DSM 20109]
MSGDGTPGADVEEVVDAAPGPATDDVAGDAATAAHGTRHVTGAAGEPADPDLAAPEPAAPAGPAWWRRVAAWPWWVHVLLVWAASRVLVAGAFLWTSTVQEATHWASANPSYLQFVGLFYDAGWYQQIAEGAYPAELPRDDQGLVQQNAWAFFPLFPALVRVVMQLTGGTWVVVAPLVATALGGAAMLVVHECVRYGAPRAVAARPGLPLASVALVCAFPTAAVLQVAYTEAAALLLIATSLLLLVRRQYAWAVLAILALGLTRAVALPMAVVVVVHAGARWWRARRGEDTFGPREAAGLAGVAAAAGLSGVAWPAICGWVTGVPDGYLQTQEAWRGVREVTPFHGWTYVPQFWLGEWGVPAMFAGFALVAAVLVVPAAWRLGPELHAWSAAYLLYIVAVIEPGSSLARFLLLAFPLAAATVGVVRRPTWARRLWFGAILLLMLGLQVLWVRQMWEFNPHGDWPP